MDLKKHNPYETKAIFKNSNDVETWILIKIRKVMYRNNVNYTFTGREIRLSEIADNYHRCLEHVLEISLFANLKYDCLSSYPKIV